MNLFSRAGLQVVEYKDYGVAVDLVLEKPIDSLQFRELYEKLLKEYSVLMLQLKTINPVVRLVEYTHREHTIYRYRWILTISTLVTVFLTGYGLTESLYLVAGRATFTWILLESILYTTLFLGALLSHELGHLYVSRSEHIDAEGPVLLPAPPIQLGFLGTFGAVIFTKTPPVSKRALAKLGISGPLVGFIATTIVGLIGLWLSPTISWSIAEELTRQGELQPISYGSIMFYILLLLRPVPPDKVLLIHPLLFMANILYLITFLNLLPIGQLDGGHVIRSFTRESEFKIISALPPVILILLGIAVDLVYGIGEIYIGMGFVSLLLYLIIGRRGHPGIANQYDESKCYLCPVLYIILLVLCTPIPLAL